MAGQLELRDDQMMLHTSLMEEKEVDALLTDIAKGEVNPDALAVVRSNWRRANRFRIG